MPSRTGSRSPGQAWTRSSPTSGTVSAWTIPSGRSGRPAERHGYRDGVGEPVGSARVPRCSAHRLQVPHRRPEPVQRVTDREPVAVPYDVREGPGVPSVLAGPARLQLAEDRVLHVGVQRPEGLAGPCLLRDRRPGPVVDPGALAGEEVR